MPAQLFSAILVLTISFSSCKNHKDSTKSPEMASEKTTPANECRRADENKIKTDSTVIVVGSLKADNYRLIVVFYSIGMGTDGPSLLKFEESIGDYSKEIGKNFDYERANWGREGETDFCLRLNELSATQQTEFVSKTKELLKSAKWVNIYENKPCQHKRRR